MGDKRRPANELENAPTQSLPQGADAVSPLLRELAHTPEVFAGSLARGSRLGGRRYTVERLVGKGGMGTVYLAIDEVLGKEVALKLVDERFAKNLDRLRDEVLLAQEVSHRNVCRTYDLEEVEGHWLVKMEYIDGQTLADKVAAAGRLSVTEARAIGRQIAHGLAAAHERGVVHRDLKPQNILVEKDSDRVVLMDFGLARLAELAGQTAEGVAGTPEYMAPEQARGREVDGRADLYSLGCVLYHMLTGQAVFPAETAMAAALRHAEDPPPDPRAARPDIPLWLAQLILRLLEKDPARRPADAAQVAAALAGPPQRWRHVARLALLAAAFAGVALLVWRLGRPPAGPDWVPVPMGNFDVQQGIRYVSINRDGTTLASVIGREIWVEPRAGGGRRRRVAVPAGVPPLQYALPSRTGDQVVAAFSKDFVTHEFWALDVVGGKAERRVPPASAPTMRVGHEHDVGPDGSLVVVEYPGDGTRWRLSQVDPAGSVRPLVDADAGGKLYNNLSLSPDGTRVVFTRMVNSEFRIEVVDVATRTATVVARRECRCLDWLSARSLGCVDPRDGAPVVVELTLPDGSGEAIPHDRYVAPAYSSFMQLIGTSAGVFMQTGSRRAHLVALDLEHPGSPRPIATGSVTDVAPAGWTSSGALIFGANMHGRLQIMARYPDGTIDVVRAASVAEVPLVVLGDTIVFGQFPGGDRSIPMADELYGRKFPDGELYRLDPGAAPRPLGPTHGFLALRCAGDRAPPCLLIEHEGDDARAVWWDPASGARGREVSHWSLMQKGFQALAPDAHTLAHVVFPSGSIAVSHLQLGELELEDLESGGVRRISVPEHPFRYLAWEPNGVLVETGGSADGYNGEVMRIRDDGNETLFAPPNGNYYLEPRVSPDGKELVMPVVDQGVGNYWWVPR